jgi:hypothetical protein
MIGDSQTMISLVGAGGGAAAGVLLEPALDEGATAAPGADPGFAPAVPAGWVAGLTGAAPVVVVGGTVLAGVGAGSVVVAVRATLATLDAEWASETEAIRRTAPLMSAATTRQLQSAARPGRRLNALLMTTIWVILSRRLQADDDRAAATKGGRGPRLPLGPRSSDASDPPQEASPRWRRRRITSHITPPMPTSQAPTLTRIEVGEPVKGSTPPTLIPPTDTDTGSNRFVTVIVCAGLSTLRVNWPFPSGANETFEAPPLFGSVTVQVVVPLAGMLMPRTVWLPPAVPNVRLTFVPSVQLTLAVKAFTSFGGFPLPVTTLWTSTLPTVDAPGKMLLIATACWVSVSIVTVGGIAEVGPPFTEYSALDAPPWPVSVIEHTVPAGMPVIGTVPEVSAPVESNVNVLGNPLKGGPDAGHATDAVKVAPAGAEPKTVFETVRLPVKVFVTTTLCWVVELIVTCGAVDDGEPPLTV